MKRKPFLLLGLVLGIGALISLGWVGVTHAADVRASDSPTVNKDETVDGALYTAGNKITIAGTVKGDVFCAGNEIDITGVVEGDVLCAGQTLHIGGKVMGDVRVAGNDVTISAQVDGSATMAGNKTSLSPDARIGRDILLAGQTLQLDGEVGRDVLGTGYEVSIKGTVGRHVELEVETLALASTAKVGGNLNYAAPGQASVADGAVISGTTTYKEATERSQIDENALRLWIAVYWLMAMLMIGIVAILIAPRVTDAIGAGVRTNLLSAFVGGAVAFLMTPLIAALLFISLVGIPLGLVIMTLWVGGVVCSLTFAAYALGWVVVEKLAWPSRGQRLASLFIGSLLLTLLGLIPWVGSMITFGAVILGLGGLVVTAGRHLRPHKTGKPAKAA